MTDPDRPALALRPFGLVGRPILGVVRYLGGMGLLMMGAARSVIRPEGSPPPFGPTVVRHVDRILRYAAGPVAILHVGLGSFLAMQAYFGATFLDGIGPVVGVGLVRNIAPLMSAMALAGLLGALYTSELRGPGRDDLDGDPHWRPDRGTGPDRDDRVEPARLAAIRMTAAALAGPLLGVWGSLVGIAVGYGVAAQMLNVSRPGFFDMFVEMLWARDVLSLVLKGMAFGLAGGWFACFEGLREPEPGDGPEARAGAAIRSTSLAGLTILVVNGAWFLLFYHAGPAFGPTVLRPPQS